MGTFMAFCGLVGALIGLGMFGYGGILKNFTDAPFEDISWWMIYGLFWIFGGVSGIALGAMANNSR